MTFSGSLEGPLAQLEPSGFMLLYGEKGVMAVSRMSQRRYQCWSLPSLPSSCEFFYCPRFFFDFNTYTFATLVRLLLEVKAGQQGLLGDDSEDLIRKWQIVPKKFGYEIDPTVHL